MFTNVGCASMGYGLPAAIGASFALDKSPVICIEGDGSLQMNIQELQTLVHHKLPVVLIVINNDGYISIKITQQNFFGGYEVASGKESGVSFPSLEKLSHAYGIEYHKITHNSEIHGALTNIFSSDICGPVICEVFTHPNEKHEPKVIHKGIDKDGKIIPGDLTNMFISETFDN
jgi:acetolactate synthase-1/2/3 large subunit